MLVSICLGIFGIFVIMVAIGCSYSCDEDEDALRAGLLVSFLLFLTIIISLSISLAKPTAMDVYRGRTTLEITYKDSIPVDSVVVFK